MLNLRDVRSGYGHLPIIHDVSLELKKGEIGVILGRNGVGKTTLLKTIMGILKTTHGTIFFDGVDITKLNASARAQKGIGFVPQGRGIFPRLTVEENLKMGELINIQNPHKLYDQVYEYFPRLLDRRSQKGGTLSGGEQQMLAIGRALVGNPELLILDEPSEGVQPSIVQKIGEVLLSLNKDLGLPILLVEQNIDFATSIAEHCYLMDKGTIAAHLDKEELLKPENIKKYLAI
jgi:urea ABC transporter ATP-binding protein UrtE